MIRSGKSINIRSRALRVLVGSSIVFALAACASAPVPPTQQLQAAELAISSAEQERVADFAPQDLKQAHDKLAAARTAVQSEDMVQAERLADESRVSAELASARTALLKTQAVNAEMQQSIDALQQEILRNSGARQ